MEDAEVQIVLYEGSGYYTRGIRKSIGTFGVVAIDWHHPNVGFFDSAMLWIKASQLEDWRPFPIVRWSERYKKLEPFLLDHPQFTQLFEDQFDE